MTLGLEGALSLLIAVLTCVAGSTDASHIRPTLGNRPFSRAPLGALTRRISRPTFGNRPFSRSMSAATECPLSAPLSPAPRSAFTWPRRHCAPRCHHALDYRRGNGSATTKRPAHRAAEDAPASGRHHRLRPTTLGRPRKYDRRHSTSIQQLPTIIEMRVQPRGPPLSI